MADTANEDGLSQTAKYWSVIGLDRARRDHWESHPVVQAFAVNARHGQSRMQRLASRLAVTGGRGLGLGVGAASSELELLTLNAVSSYDLYDVTPQLIAAAEQAAVGAGLQDRVRCHVCDVNALSLPPDSYDLITFVSSLHHIEQLEHVVEECRRALRPNGVFYAQEYVGPNRFAFPRDHVGLAKRIWQTLDPALRCRLPELPTPDPVAVAAADPTESIRSEEILSVCGRIFPDAEVLSGDVCLTLILWYGLNHDALFETAAGEDLVSWLLEVDRSLVQSGRLPTYHAEIIARKHGS